MSTQIDTKTLHRLDVQGFDNVPVAELVPFANWLRLPYVLCATLAITGVALASPLMLWALAPIAALSAIFPVHPFDLIYNLGIRHLRGTGPFPKRGVPARFACGMGAAWLIATGFVFQSGNMTMGYVLGGVLAAMATLVAVTNICIPSITYRMIFGAPKLRESEEADLPLVNAA